ncbi:MAG: YdhR family protein [Nitriliruptorales bacterium]
MHIQIVSFRLKGLTDEEFLAGCNEDAAAYAAVPGLISKVWLHDPGRGRYGGVKTWTDRDAMQDYLNSDLWQSFVTSPQFTDVVSSDFEVIEKPTRVTRGFVKATELQRLLRSALAV